MIGTTAHLPAGPTNWAYFFRIARLPSSEPGKTNRSKAESMAAVRLGHILLSLERTT